MCKIVPEAIFPGPKAAAGTKSSKTNTVAQMIASLRRELELVMLVARAVGFDSSLNCKGKREGSERSSDPVYLGRGRRKGMKSVI